MALSHFPVALLFLAAFSRPDMTLVDWALRTSYVSIRGCFPLSNSPLISGAISRFPIFPSFSQRFPLSNISPSFSQRFPLSDTSFNLAAFPAFQYPLHSRGIFPLFDVTFIFAAFPAFKYPL